MRAIMGVALVAALGLSGCMSTGAMAPPTGDSAAALEAYRIYASRCSSHVSLPLVASHTCERLQPPPPAPASASDMAAAIVKALIDAGVIPKPGS
jgi:hypothetical protein